MKRRQTNWERFLDDQVKHPAIRSLVEEELCALRVGAQIAALRQRQKFSPTQLAARAGMSGPNISRIENDPSHNLTLGRLTRIASALGYKVQIKFQRRRKSSQAASQAAGAAPM